MSNHLFGDECGLKAKRIWLRFTMLFMATLGWSMRTVTRSMSVKRYGLRLETASKDS